MSAPNIYTCASINLGQQFYFSDDVSSETGLCRIGFLLNINMTILKSFWIIIHHRSNSISALFFFFCMFVCLLSILHPFNAFVCLYLVVVCITLLQCFCLFVCILLIVLHPCNVFLNFFKNYILL
jgi:hypothetical protein